MKNYRFKKIKKKFAFLKKMYYIVNDMKKKKEIGNIKFQEKEKNKGALVKEFYLFGIAYFAFASVPIFGGCK